MFQEKWYQFNDAMDREWEASPHVHSAMYQAQEEKHCATEYRCIRREIVERIGRLMHNSVLDTKGKENGSTLMESMEKTLTQLVQKEL
jgi:hypothetical protein